MKPSKKLRSWLRAAWVAGVCLLVVGSLLPGSSPAIAWLGGVSDKLLHFAAYGVLGLLAVLAAENRRAALRSVAIMFVLGVTLDALQRLVPGRSFEWGDVLADNMGLLWGACCGVWLLR